MAAKINQGWPSKAKAKAVEEDLYLRASPIARQNHPEDKWGYSA